MGLQKDALSEESHCSATLHPASTFSLLRESISLLKQFLCSRLLSSSSQFSLLNGSRLLSSFILTDLQLLQFNTLSHLEENGSQLFLALPSYFFFKKFSQHSCILRLIPCQDCNVITYCPLNC